MSPTHAPQNSLLENPSPRRGETESHFQLKRLALLWAQENDFSLAAFEVSLPKCRYRADVAAYRPQKNRSLGITAIFECKQSSADLHRDDCRTEATRLRLETILRRRFVLERNLRVHHPTLRTGDTLFPEWDAWDFAATQHRGYARLMRETVALQRQLRDGRKFEKLARYTCANLFFLVAPNELIHEPETPAGWGVLAENAGALTLCRKPVWHESSDATRLHVLQKIAAAGTRLLNRQQQIAPLTPMSLAHKFPRDDVQRLLFARAPSLGTPG